MDRSIHFTYELYLTDQTGAVSFEPLTCPRDKEVLALARQLLAERNLRSIEVRQFGEHLLTIDAA